MLVQCASTSPKSPWRSKLMARRINSAAFSTFLYRFRNLAGRFFNKLKHQSYRVKLAATRILGISRAR